MNHATIRIRNDLPEIPHAARKVTQFLSARGLDQSFIHTVNLGLEEVVTNIIKYGYDDEREHVIEVTLHLAPSGLRIVVVDDGHAFDPLQHPEPDPTRPLADREPGGLGVSMFRKLFDELQYRRQDDKNSLLMEKRLPDPIN
jgi:anti-sigma regulatory factor (Ser/Thr protein kinase)